MSRRERVELVLIPLAALGAWAARPLLPGELAAGSLVLTGAALLLGQGLLRDLHLKYAARVGQGCRVDYATGRAVAMCMESTLGVLAIALGAGLLFAGAGGRVGCGGAFWPLFVLGVGGAGFALKDVVIDFRARRLRVEKDHLNVVLW